MAVVSSLYHCHLRSDRHLQPVHRITPPTGRQVSDDRRDPVSHVVDVRQRCGTFRAAGDHSRPPPSAILAPHCLLSTRIPNGLRRI